MERVGQWDPPGMPIHSGVQYNDVWGYTASDGSEYAILGNVDSIMIIDVTNASNPQRVFGFYGGGHAIWRDFKVHQDHAYAVCDGCNEGMHIFDLSALPSGEVTHVATIDTFFNRAHNIFIDNATQKLYAAGTETAFEGLVVIDVSTPDVPVRLANYIFQESGNFYVHDLFVKNDTAYCSHGTQGYYVWDMTNLSNVELLGSYDSPGYNHSSWNHSSGQYAYYAEEIPLGRPLAVIDLSNLGSTTSDIQVVKLFKHPLSTTALNVTPHNPFVKNDSLFISYYEDGFKVYDLANPVSPELVGYYDTYPTNGNTYTGYEGGWGTYPFFASGNILVSDITFGLNIIKVQTCATPETYYRDKDGDGFGNASESVSSCSFPGGYVLDNTDCNDSDESIYPGSIEVCDNVDNDCDGQIDQADADVVLTVFYLDSDGDGYGDINFTVEDCVAPTGYVEDNTDCDDTNNMINPGFPEICDGIDNDCDDLIDGADSDLTSIEWFFDEDSDGVGISAVSLYQCTQPDGYVAFVGDCDDSDPNNFPDNPEVCDGQDNNCDGIVDEGCAQEPCDGTSIYVNPVNQEIYRAKIDLNSDADGNGMTDYKFYAEQEINLNPGFEVPISTDFLADIEPCDNSGNATIIEPEEVPWIEDLYKSYTEDGWRFILKTNNHSKTDKFKSWEEAKKRLQRVKSDNQEFKLYIFKYGDLVATLSS